MRVQTNDEEFLDPVQKKLRAVFVSLPSKRFSLGVYIDSISSGSDLLPTILSSQKIFAVLQNKRLSLARSVRQSRV